VPTPSLYSRIPGQLSAILKELPALGSQELGSSLAVITRILVTFRMPKTVMNGASRTTTKVVYMYVFESFLMDGPLNVSTVSECIRKTLFLLNVLKV
jgi:hypothetical protein